MSTVLSLIAVNGRPASSATSCRGESSCQDCCPSKSSDKETLLTSDQMLQRLRERQARTSTPVFGTSRALGVGPRPQTEYDRHFNRRPLANDARSLPKQYAFHHHSAAPERAAALLHTATRVSTAPSTHSTLEARRALTSAHSAFPLERRSSPAAHVSSLLGPTSPLNSYPPLAQLSSEHAWFPANASVQQHVHPPPPVHPHACKPNRPGSILAPSPPCATNAVVSSSRGAQPRGGAVQAAALCSVTGAAGVLLPSRDCPTTAAARGRPSTSNNPITHSLLEYTPTNKASHPQPSASSIPHVLHAWPPPRPISSGPSSIAHRTANLLHGSSTRPSITPGAQSNSGSGEKGATGRCSKLQVASLQQQQQQQQQQQYSAKNTASTMAQPSACEGLQVDQQQQGQQHQPKTDAHTQSGLVSSASIPHPDQTSPLAIPASTFLSSSPPPVLPGESVPEPARPVPLLQLPGRPSATTPIPVHTPAPTPVTHALSASAPVPRTPAQASPTYTPGAQASAPWTQPPTAPPHAYSSELQPSVPTQQQAQTPARQTVEPEFCFKPPLSLSRSTGQQQPNSRGRPTSASSSVWSTAVQVIPVPPPPHALPKRTCNSQSQPATPVAQFQYSCTPPQQDSKGAHSQACMAAQEAATIQVLEGLKQMRGAGGGAESQVDSRPQSPWPIQADRANDLDAASIDIVYTSAWSSRPETAGSSGLPSSVLANSPFLGANSSRPRTPLVQSKSQLGSKQHAPLTGDKDMARGERMFSPQLSFGCGVSGLGSSFSTQPVQDSMKDRHRSGDRHTKGTAPFVKQAAPMVLCLDDPCKSSEEVLQMELNYKLAALSLENLKELNNLL